NLYEGFGREISCPFNGAVVTGEIVSEEYPGGVGTCGRGQMSAHLAGTSDINARLKTIEIQPQKCSVLLRFTRRRVCVNAVRLNPWPMTWAPTKRCFKRIVTFNDALGTLW